MLLYKILFIANDKNLINNIVNQTDWQGYGFNPPLSAEGTEKILDQAYSLNPDIVIIDIDMPYVNGFELCKNISEYSSDVKFIFLSSLEKKNYNMRQSVKTNIAEYIMKPINMKDFHFLLEKLKFELDLVYKKNDELLSLRNHYIQSLPIIREQFFINLIEGNNKIYDSFETNAFYNVHESAKIQMAADIRADDYAESIEEHHLNLTSLKNIVTENLEPFCHSESFVHCNNVIVIAMLDSNRMIQDLINKLNRICNMSLRFLSFGISIGAGRPCIQLKDLRHSYLDAIRAVKYRIFKEPNQTIYINNIEVSSLSRLKLNKQDESRLTGNVKLGTFIEIKDTIDKLFLHYESHSYSYEQCHVYLMEMISVIINLAKNCQLDMEEAFKGKLSDYLNLDNFGSIVDLKNWFYECCIVLNNHIKQDKLHVTKFTVERAKQFIEENYNHPEISVEMLCNHLQMSPAYFSTVFKRESGLSFVSYLTNVRMERAMELLNYTKEKSGSISALVGYTDPNYFSYVFKKHYGISPSKYRKT